jgi:hypothetical protein
MRATGRRTKQGNGKLVPGTCREVPVAARHVPGTLPPLNAWGTAAADIDGNGVTDLLVLLNSWT